jgi:hypothetical protein
MHVALIAESRFIGNARGREIGLAQHTHGPLDAEPCGRLQGPFAGRTLVGGSEPRRMSSHVIGETFDSRARVLTKPPCDGANPRRRRSRRLASGALHELPHGRAQTLLIDVF